MKKAIIFIVVAALCAMTIQAVAADVFVEAKVSDIITKIDKNGNPYAVLIFEEQRTLNGVNYTAEVIATAFRRAYEQAKDIKPGDTVNVIAARRTYNGDAAYTIRAFVKKP